MNKNQKLIIIFRCVATVLLLIFVLGFLTNVFERKDSKSRFLEFYELQENVDVLLLGSSHMFNGISPMDMWEQNGIVAYNLGAPGCRIASSWWILKNALQYTSPQLVVLDCAYLLDEKANNNINYMHRVFDTMPLSRIKIEALQDIYDSKEDILRFLFPFSVYHNRWAELEKSDFFYEPVYGKMGFAVGCDVVNAELPDFAVAEVQPIDNVSTQYLELIVDLCKQQGIQLLLTFIPFNCNESSLNDAAYVQTIADLHGLNYLGPENLAKVINLCTDFNNHNDNNSHLNLSGAHKMSYYLGAYIAKSYNLPDRRQNPKYGSWHDYYELYQAYKLSLLKEQTALENYLVAMADWNYSYIVYLNDTACLQDEPVCELLRNLDLNIGEISEEGTCLLTKNKWANESEKVKVLIDKEENPAVYINENMVCCWDGSDGDSGIYIMVMDENTKHVLDTAVFASATKERLPQ